MSERESPLMKAVGDYLQTVHGLHFCTECGEFHVHDPNARHARLAQAYNAARHPDRGDDWVPKRTTGGET